MQIHKDSRIVFINSRVHALDEFQEKNRTKGLILFCCKEIIA